MRVKYPMHDYICRACRIKLHHARECGRFEVDFRISLFFCVYVLSIVYAFRVCTRVLFVFIVMELFNL